MTYSPLAQTSFYIIAFWSCFLLSIPIGPVNIEVFQNALKKRYSYALSVALGAGVGDAIWASLAFFGISPFLKNNYNFCLEGFFLLATSIITFIIGIISLRDAHLAEKIEKQEEELAKKISGRKRAGFLKGFTLVAVNPLGIGSWFIILSFLKKLGIYIPNEIKHIIFYFIVVTAGAFAYFLLITILTRKFKNFFNPQRTRKVICTLGFLLIAFSIYFLYFAARAFYLYSYKH